METLVEFRPKQIGEKTGLVLATQQPTTLVLRSTNSGIRLVLRSNEPEGIIATNIGFLGRLRLEVNTRGILKFSYAIKPNLDQFNPVVLPILPVPRAWIGAYG